MPMARWSRITLSEIEAFDAFKQTHGGVVPVNIQVLRDWHRLHMQKQTRTAKVAPNGKKPIAVAA